MINDKRIAELKETIEEQKEQLRRQAQAIIDKDAQIRQLESEIGVMTRTLMTFGDRLTKEGKI